MYLERELPTLYCSPSSPLKKDYEGPLKCCGGGGEGPGKV